MPMSSIIRHRTVRKVHMIDCNNNGYQTETTLCICDEDFTVLIFTIFVSIGIVAACLATPECELYWNLFRTPIIEEMTPAKGSPVIVQELKDISSITDYKGCMLTVD
uniref:Neur_chan_memb domain-containing protein n=1 Tax=Rhabditophanes sp. KR3021 TaxID=114890 RepID=A0AC35TWR2_9BILA